MIKVIRTIERALAQIYNLELPVRAEDFLLCKPSAGTVVSSAKNFEAMHGAIYLQYNEAQEAAEEPQLDVGIFFSDALRETLSSTSIDKPDTWSEAQSHAVAIAGEEISHFHYLLYHALSGRSVSQLELEIQGDIDKFLLLYFSKRQWEEHSFDEVFERVFEKFSLSGRLTSEQINRYLEANQFARKCIHKHRKVLQSSEKMEAALKSLRRFYRLGASEKISLLAP